MLEGLFQPMHLLVILVIVLIIFGPGKLPQIGSGLGKSIKEFKKAMSDLDRPELEEKPLANRGEPKSPEERKS